MLNATKRKRASCNVVVAKGLCSAAEAMMRAGGKSQGPVGENDETSVQRLFCRFLPPVCFSPAPLHRRQQSESHCRLLARKQHDSE